MGAYLRHGRIPVKKTVARTEVRIDMCVFLQNCPRGWDYDDDTELKISMKPQDIASSRESVENMPN